jgi:hypothetical protein
LSERRLTPSEMQLLKEAFKADCKLSNVRLREGEHQYDLVKTIALFHLELCFPDVKDIVRRLYGEERINDIQLVRKVQTILKKMEKSNTVKILPKKKPWELQTYALSSFKFQDAEKNTITLATEEQIKQAEHLLHLTLGQDDTSKARLNSAKNRIYASALVLMIVASYIASVWSIMQSVISPLIYGASFSAAVAASLILGKTLSKG